jgi:hypothetical protein
LTIVAALKIEGIPALIGDFLVTDKLEYGHSWLPTRPQEFPYRPLPRRIRNLRRKLHLINERFIVGFTGSVNAGAAIFAELERLFGKGNMGPSIQQINEALQKFNVQFCHDPAILIGWSCRSRPRCFKWSAGLNSLAAAVPYAIEGSGNFAGVLTNEGGPHRTDFDRTTGALSCPGQYTGSVRTAFQKAILLGLVKLGSVLTDEVFTGRNLQESYGCGGEIALYTGRRFEFVSGIGYFFWYVRIEQNGSFTLSSWQPIKALYEARDRHCVLQVDRFSNAVDSKSIITPYIAAITPFHYAFQNLGLPNPTLLTPECSYYFNGIVIHDTRTNQIIGPLKLAQFASDIPGSFRVLKIEDDVYRIAWNHKYFEDLIRWALAETSEPSSFAGNVSASRS